METRYWRIIILLAFFSCNNDTSKSEGGSLTFDSVGDTSHFIKIDSPNSVDIKFKHINKVIRVHLDSLIDITSDTINDNSGQKEIFHRLSSNSGTITVSSDELSEIDTSLSDSIVKQRLVVNYFLYGGEYNEFQYIDLRKISDYKVVLIGTVHVLYLLYYYFGKGQVVSILIKDDLMTYDKVCDLIKVI